MVGPIGVALSFQAAPLEKRGTVMGVMGLPMLIATILGPLLSGYFIYYVSWHCIFFNFPIGAIAYFMGSKYLPAHPTQQNVKLDKTGMILAPITFYLPRIWDSRRWSERLERRICSFLSGGQDCRAADLHLG